MMHKKTLHSLLIVSFIAVFAASTSFAADEVAFGNIPVGLSRCQPAGVSVTASLNAPVSGIEVIVDVSNLSGCGDLTDLAVTWGGSGLPSDKLTTRYIDLSMAPLIRFYAMNTSGNPAGDLAQGGIIATFGFKTGDCCEGEAQIVGAVWPSQPPFGPIQTQFVDAATGGLRPAAVTGGVIAMNNFDPTMDDIVGGPFTILHGELFQLNLGATDGDLINGCEILSYDVVSGPAGMSITGTTLSWQTDGDDVCEFAGDIILKVTDRCGAIDEADPFQICVTNNPPAITVIPTAIQEIAWGMTYQTTIEAVDPDPGPYGPVFSIVNWGYAALPPTIDPNTGELTWVTLYEPEYTGLFTVEVKATDNANTCNPCAPVNSDVQSFQIRVVPFQLTIQKVEHVIVGLPVVVSITMLDATYTNKELGGFDFLIQYDASAMTFLMAEEGQFLVDCEWEYFTYRYGANGNCGGPCPEGVLRVVAMGETTGGNLAHHPICLTNGPGVSNELVKLHFRVSSDWNLNCNYAPIRWVWYDCADNGVSSAYGEQLFISDKVYAFDGFDPAGASLFRDITGMDQTFPTFTGAPDIPECNQDQQSWKHPWRLVHFYNGGLDIECSDSIDAPGDININNIPYEIADAVMFTNYFIEGLSAFGSHVDGSVAASDTNRDGIALSVADLVYLIRVVIGDALPYAKLEPVSARVTYDNGKFGVDREMGAAYIVVEGDVTPNLLADNMDMKVGFDGANTRILVYSLEANQTFSGDFLEAHGQIVSTEFATFTGQPVVAKVLPTSFQVDQNYPNPFNPTTKITIQVPNAGAWSMDIFNINGQLVESFSGVSESGFETIVWDASELSSGIYFYKVAVGQNSITKKAVLLK